jgi:hypothetical protein
MTPRVGHRLRWAAAPASFALAVALGCAPAVAPGTDSLLPVYPMALILSGSHEAGDPLGQLLKDGSIVTKREGAIARVLRDRVIDRNGRPKLVVSWNGDVWLTEKLPPMHFDGRGALVAPTGEMIYVDDNGIPSWTVPLGDAPPFIGVRFTPFNPAARRTAEVVFAILLETAWSRDLT